MERTPTVCESYIYRDVSKQSTITPAFRTKHTKYKKDYTWICDSFKSVVETNE